jgi:hypothetical protein
MLGGAAYATDLGVSGAASGTVGGQVDAGGNGVTVDGSVNGDASTTGSIFGGSGSVAGNAGLNAELTTTLGTDSDLFFTDDANPVLRSEEEFSANFRTMSSERQAELKSFCDSASAKVDASASSDAASADANGKVTADFCMRFRAL